MKIKTITLLIVLVVLLTSCQKKIETYDLGFIGTLSGPYAEVGLSEMYGTQLAIDEINAEGGINGREIVLHIRDDEADPVKAVEMQNELYELGIDIVIGHSLSLVANESVANANSKGILLLSPSIGTTEVTGLDDNLLRNVADVGFEGAFITGKIIEDNPSKILMIYNLDNIVLTSHHREAFIEVLTENGYDEDDYDTMGFETDNITQINAIKNALDITQYDSVFIAASNLDSAGFVNYIKVNDMDADIHLTSWASTGLIDNIDITKSDGIYAYINFDFFNTTPEYVSFSQKYEELYSEDVSMLSVNAYDITYILKEAIENIDSFDYDLVKTEILAIGSFEGINSSFVIDEYGDCLREHLQLVIIDGEYVINED